MSSGTAQQLGGYLVIAKFADERCEARHYSTEDEALAVARQFAEQGEGHEAFVTEAKAYFYYTPSNRPQRPGL